MGQRDGGEEAESRIGLAFVAVDDVDDAAHDRYRLRAKGADNMNELDDAQPPLPALILGDERLWLSKALATSSWVSPCCLRSSRSSLRSCLC